MKAVAALVLTLIFSYQARAKVDCEVAAGEGMVEYEKFAVDAHLSNQPAESMELVDVMVFGTDEFLDRLEEILKNPKLPKKVEEYTEYKELLAEDWDFTMERLDEIAAKLHGGDKQAAIAYLEKAQESTVRQLEFEKNEFMEFLTSVGPLSAPHGLERRSEQAWMIRNVHYGQARNLLQLLDREDTWLRYIKIFKAESPLSACRTGACTI